MNWIRKTFIFVSLLIMGLFASQANGFPVQKIESQKTDSNFAKDIADSSAFIQPQGNYQFAANIKTDSPAVIKWFDTLLLVVPQHETVKSTFDLDGQFLIQSKKIVLMLYAFHFFW